MRRFPWATPILLAGLVLLGGLGWATAVHADPPRPAKQRLLDRVCNLIEAHADQNGLPKDFFARLIWKESRFDPNAVSPVGAEGIAQFMPGTAKLRGLAN
ncbi:MAG: lytic transglycosylase domain-containing protein, partial [Mesorhizobium sp.]